ncbi:sigma-54-dependent transcriptional regulator [Geothermobacter hydrogeniphilus]|nr:sigma-54 dependent transcriptional regulator [Geothermobacter hydrogeniphilus]
MVEMIRHILVIDDEPGMRSMLRMVLERTGYQVSDAETGPEGLELLERKSFSLILCDIRMPEMDGMAFLKELQRRRVAATVIMMSAYGSLDTAVECLKQGAYDYISKPFKPDEIILTLRKAEERMRLLRENRLLKKELARNETLEDLVYRSSVMANLAEQVAQVAVARSPVLVTGETGTGKELIARALHFSSQRKDGPFLAVNCSAIAPSLLESELFGHARGAFTGADKARDGLFIVASGGTLFLDEIGELPLELQPKLLRVLQEGEVRRVGETRPRRIDTRVVVATARNLQDEVAAGRFRSDLFFRLAVIELTLPPLRERCEDIPLLAEHFVRTIAYRERRPVPKLHPEVMARLQAYNWPGNVRELENFIEKTMIFCRGDEISIEALPWEMRRRNRQASRDLSLKRAVRRLEREYIHKALAETDGNRTKAAKLLEISLRSLMYKIKEYQEEG